jgi:hypothetical protein
MDTGARLKREVGNGQEKSVTWSQYFAQNRDWLTKQIDALESMDQITGEKRPTLDLTWVLSLYRLSREYLDAFNESHVMTHEMKTLVEPLKKRARLLEAGPSGERSHARWASIETPWRICRSPHEKSRSGHIVE